MRDLARTRFRRGCSRSGQETMHVAADVYGFQPLSKCLRHRHSSARRLGAAKSEAVSHRDDGRRHPHVFDAVGVRRVATDKRIVTGSRAASAAFANEHEGLAVPAAGIEPATP